MVKSASSLVNAVLDPVLAKRAGLSIALVDAWPEIAGARTAKLSCPLKIDWPRRASPEDDFRPGVLVVAAGGSVAIYLQHESTEIVGRINAFMGFQAIERIRIVQKAIAPPVQPERLPARALSDDETSRIAELADGFEDEALRQSVRRLGESVYRARR